jgi:hypothetical protein
MFGDQRPLPEGEAFGRSALKSAELVLKAGGFGLLVIDFGDSARPLTQSAALRLARAAERCSAAVLALASQRLCGTFSALSLSLVRSRARFSRLAPDAPVLFDGFTFETRVARNKLGPMGQRAIVHALVDPVLTPSFEAQLNAPSPWSGRGSRAATPNNRKSKVGWRIVPVGRVGENRGTAQAPSPSPSPGGRGNRARA